MLRGILVTILGFVVVSNSFRLKTSNWKNNIRYEDYSVCHTQECENMANVIIKGMNKTADPCEDFYSYVCGSWAKNYPVPEGKLRWDLGSMVQKNIQAFLQKTVEEIPSSKDSVPLSIEKKWFRACMNEERIERRGLEPLAKIIEEIGGWPIAMKAGKWDKNKYPWQKVAKYYANLLGAFSLFSFGITPDSQNSSIQVMSLDQPRRSLLKHRLYDGILNDAAKDDEEDDQSFDFFYNVPFNYANFTGNSVHPELLVGNTMRFVNFYYALKKIKSPTKVNKEVDLSKNKMTINDLQIYYDRKTSQNDTSKIDWLDMIRSLMADTGIEIDESEQIVVMDKPYIDRLFKLLEMTPHETIVNYLHWGFVMSTITYLNKEINESYEKSSNSKSGVKPKERLAQCISGLPSNDGLTFEYLKNHFPEDIKKAVTEMAEEIREEIRNDISHSSWMDSETKLLAKEKLEAMKVRIGYPEYYDDEKKFNSLYDGIEVGPDYFENVMSYVKHRAQITLKNLKKPFDKEQWFMTPLTINAYYLPPTNSLTIPAAQMLVPVYSSKGPLAANYGSVGLIIGHEMSHGFDVTGRQFDKNGNAIPWWSDEVVAEYQERADCFIKQYDRYQVNGRLTQGENIADTSGLNAAFAAYSKKKNKVTKEMRLPGMEDIKGDQLFFLAFANTFCQSATPYYESLLEKDVHTKTSVRINGVIKNVDGFAEAFQCSKNSNPEEKCILWD